MPTLEFKGKQHIYAHHLTVPYRCLLPDKGRSVDPAGVDDNLIIHGDNLEALKALLPRYAGRVKCIYIDPPYNTGNEGWVYNDRVNSPLMRAWLKDNGPVDGEDLERHDKWLCMMWPRLHLLKELLAEDGAIFISIDDNEQHHLRIMMDEILSAENFVSNIIWQKKYAPANDAKWLSDDHDFLLVYAKEKVRWRPKKLERTSEQDKSYKNLDNDLRGPWKTSDYTSNKSKDERPNLYFPIENPNTGKTIWPNESAVWRYTQEQHLRNVSEDRIWWGKSGKNDVPAYKRFLSEVGGVVPRTVWSFREVGHNQTAKREIMGVFADASDVFQTPKPTGLIERILRIATDKDSIILDSFAGSGTTAHAVLALNKGDGGNRKFILVECEDYADGITAERVRRVIQGVPTAKDAALREGLGGSFTYCTLGEPLDAEAMLTGEALPDRPALSAWLLHTASGISAGSSDLAPQNGDGLFYASGTTDYYLLYESDMDWLRSNEAILNEERAKRIEAASKERGRKAVVFGPGKYIGQRDLTRMGITFCQLPYELHRAG